MKLIYLEPFGIDTRNEISLYPGNNYAPRNYYANKINLGNQILNKKVFAFITGGIGNQMFTYAAARTVAARNDASLVLLTNHYDREPHGRHFLLDNFEINAEIARIEDAGIPYNHRTHQTAKTIDRYLKCFSRHHRNYFIERSKNILGKHSPVDTRILTTQVNDYLFIQGLFMDESYFSDCSDIIRSEFRLKNCPTAETRKLANEMASTNSVCIHFRRTEMEFSDMLRKRQTKSQLGGYRHGLDASYYEKAIALIEKNLDSPHYFCFSDYPEWIKENIQLKHPFTIVNHNNNQIACYEDLFLMSKCDHHIISHSSFSWWGAWLSDNPDQLIVAPVNVCGRPKPPYYPYRWKTIDVCQEKIQ